MASTFTEKEPRLSGELDKSYIGGNCSRERRRRAASNPRLFGLLKPDSKAHVAIIS